MRPIKDRMGIPAFKGEAIMSTVYFYLRKNHFNKNRISTDPASVGAFI